MNPADLRKGNIVNTFIKTTDGNKYSIGVIQCLHMNTVECDNNETHPYNLLEPIPVSDEWLRDFGFTQIKGAHTSWLEKKVTEDWTMAIQYLRVKNDVYYGRTKINFIHQLQNLYYALTGQELKSIHNLHSKINK